RHGIGRRGAGVRYSQSDISDGSKKGCWQTEREESPSKVVETAGDSGDGRAIRVDSRCAGHGRAAEEDWCVRTADGNSIWSYRRDLRDGIGNGKSRRGRG